MENPFITRSPVKNPDGFYGREDILKKIIRDIGRKQIQSHCVIGERRIGKTSLLYQIMHNQIQRKYIGEVRSLIFVKSDVNLFPHAQPDAFFDEWAKDISRVSDQPSPKNPGYLSFKRFLENVTEAGHTIVTLLDEFEATATNENLDRGFFEFLRALTQNYDISFILFSRTPLQYFLRIEKFRSKFSSPFFNTLNISYLKHLKEPEARDLIAEPAQKAGIDITEFTDFILEQAYFHPFLLQLLSSIVFDSKRSSDTDQDKMLREFKIQTEEFFDYLWKHSGADEQEALKKLASEDQDIPKMVRDNLDRRSILTEDRNKIFCPLFEEFIKRKI
jgi:hypothetical protein